MMYGNRGFGPEGCFGNGFFGGPHFMMMGFIILVLIAVAIWAWKKRSAPQDNDILMILKEKYVRGEITEEEYLSRKNILTRK